MISIYILNSQKEEKTTTTKTTIQTRKKEHEHNIDISPQILSTIPKYAKYGLLCKRDFTNAKNEIYETVQLALVIKRNKSQLYKTTTITFCSCSCFCSFSSSSAVAEAAAAAATATAEK